LLIYCNLHNIEYILISASYETTHNIFSFFFFFNNTPTTEIYTLSLHDALPISFIDTYLTPDFCREHKMFAYAFQDQAGQYVIERSEEHTSELQSQSNLVCRLLLEKKKKNLCNFERTIIIADADSEVTYMEGCTT